VPNAFRFYELEAFPADIRERSVVVPVQMSLGTEDAEDTIVEWRERISQPVPLDRLNIRHDVLINSSGRAHFEIDGQWRVESFNEYVKAHDLEAYATDDRALLIIGGPGEVVKSAYATLSKSPDARLRVLDREVDFTLLAPSLGRLRGAWFTRTAGAIHALAIFGQDVGGSPEWEEQTISSQLQSVMINHPYENEIHTITITADCGVVVYSNMERSKLLGLVLDVYATLLAPSLKH
jgi:hypothetical protein